MATFNTIPPPQYSSTSSLPIYTPVPESEPVPTPSRRPPNPRPVPRITLLFLGSPGVGKSTFISQLSRVRDGQLQPSASSTRTRSNPQPNPSSAHQLPTPNPSAFNVSLFARPYEITIYRSTSTLFVDPFPSKIDALVICYAVDDRASLYNAEKYWRRVFAERYEAEHGREVPILLLGLKRDLRTDQQVTVTRETTPYERRTEVEEKEYICVMPQQGLEAAKKMRCDRYAECSAVTGELMWEALEDITRMAASTTTDNGGFSQGESCSIM